MRLTDSQFLRDPIDYNASHPWDLGKVSDLIDLRPKPGIRLVLLLHHLLRIWVIYHLPQYRGVTLCCNTFLGRNTTISVSIAWERGDWLLYRLLTYGRCCLSWYLLPYGSRFRTGPCGCGITYGFWSHLTLKQTASLRIISPPTVWIA